MQTEQQKINKIADQFGFFLLGAGVPIIQSAHKNLKPEVLPFGEIKTAFNNHGINVPVSQYDFYYSFLDADIMEKLTWKVMTLLHKFRYRKEVTDCDDFAFLQSMLMAFLFGINTEGASWGDVYDAETGKFINGHYFNIAITYKNGEFELYCCDPLNPGFVKIEKDKPIIINDWRYVVKNGKFF